MQALLSPLMNLKILRACRRMIWVFVHLWRVYAHRTGNHLPCLDTGEIKLVLSPACFIFWVDFLTSWIFWIMASFPGARNKSFYKKLRPEVIRTGAYRTGIGLLVIIQSKSRIISAGAFVERISGRRSLGDSIALTGPRRRLRCVNLLAKQVYSAQNF